MVYHFPLNPVSFRAAEASLCAGAQGKFWEFHALLFERQPSWSLQENYLDYFRSYAQTLGLNVQQFDRCLTSREMREAVQRDRKAGEALRVNATPTIFLNNVRIVGARPFPFFDQTIKELLSQ